MLIYLLAVNALGLFIMHYDKLQAKNNLWRIPEKTLMGIAVIGGSLGCMIGMYTAHHKTQKPKFALGIPLILFGQVIAAALLLSK